MAIACTFSPVNPKTLDTVTISFTGLALTTAYSVSIVTEDGTQSAGNSIVSDGGGLASTTFVPQNGGLYTVSVTTTVVTTTQAGTVTIGASY